MNGGKQLVKIVLRNPLDHSDKIDYNIIPEDNKLAIDWIEALKKIIQSQNQLEKNFCFLGFPHTPRNLSYLCAELNSSVFTINLFNRKKIWQNAGLPPYIIEDFFTPDVLRFGDEYPISGEDDLPNTPISNLGLHLKHSVLNSLHNHFEKLQGTVWNLSEYYKLADYETKYAIRQLNNLCHEIETLVLSQHKKATLPEWIRPSQITTFLQAPRYELTDEHRQGFIKNRYDRLFGGVYMHWTQIGKTFFEVFRDEGAPELTDTVCEAITELKYYSGEFDVEWGTDVVYGQHDRQWHTEQMDNFYSWLIKNGKDPVDPRLSLGYLHIGQVDIKSSFGTYDKKHIWEILSQHLDIYKIEIGDLSATYNYCWNDLDYKINQIKMMEPGYDYSSSRRG